MEGFYGTPWSHEARLSQLRFYGQNKMNTYIYGPKDDPYHSSRTGGTLSADRAAQIKGVVKVAKENHVDFVWAIHPGKDIKWTEEDMNNVIKKDDVQAGRPSFAVFFGRNIFGERERGGDMQALLLNKIQQQGRQGEKGRHPLVMCPTEYNRGWADSSREPLDILGDRLDPPSTSCGRGLRLP